MTRVGTRWMVGGLVVMVLVCGAVSEAQMMPPPDRCDWDRLAFREDGVYIKYAIAPYEESESLAPEVRSAWTAFTTDHAGWKATIDRRSGRLEFAEGPGIPWVPGWGNQLTLADIAGHLEGRSEVTLNTLESLARGYLERYAGVLGVDPDSLVLDPGPSGRFSDYLWYVEFDVYLGARQIEDARVVFRVNNGNLIQIAIEKLPDASVRPPATTVTRDQALEIVSEYVGGFAADDVFVDEGSEHLIPLAAPGTERGEDVSMGAGYQLRLVWQFIFHRPSFPGLWQARVDATSGMILDLLDTIRYAEITGGVRVSDGLPADEIRAMPFADTGQGDYSNSAGIYTWSGGTNSSTLTGQYVNISDTCGAISMQADGAGDILFGTSGGTNCTTPGVGGAGNTHASRTQFYHVNRVSEKARSYLPGNSWLQQQLTANVNINQTCNAYWDGSSVNFFLDGDGAPGHCGNTGELPGVSLHEWGHGLDENDGNGSSPDLGTGETYGDISAATQLHESCVGSGFLTDHTDCNGGYGDPCFDCSGVRDVDWCQHQSQAPHTVTGFSCSCPASNNYKGPCGREGHCESYPSSEGVWDLATKDLVAGSQTCNGSYQDMDGPYDLSGGWSVTERLWYLTRPTAGPAFRCTCPSTGDGCVGNSYFRVFRAADDDDGNTTNGTPHSCYIAAAFDRHEVACSSDTAWNVCYTACTPPAAPTLNATPGNEQVQLSWTDSGGGVVYDVWRNEIGCSAGFTRIANDVAGLNHTDTDLANGTTYYYQVTAQPTGNEACSSEPSNCAGATPGGGSCDPLSCTGITIDADPVCSGIAQEFTASYTGGEAAFTIEWDFDDDGQYDDCASNPCSTTLPVGVNTVGVRVTDSCSDGAQTCFSSTTATVNGPPDAPLAPAVSDPFPCEASVVRISWDPVAGADTYDLRVDGVVTAGVTSPYDYDPGNMQSHNYALRASGACGDSTWSDVTPFADGTPVEEIFFCDGFENNNTGAWSYVNPGAR